MEKLKNMVVIIPAALFIFFGGETIFESLMTVLYHTSFTQSEESPISLGVKFYSI
jgi:hypothetical protein